MGVGLCYMLFPAEDSHLGERRSQGSFVDLELGLEEKDADDARAALHDKLERDASVSAFSEDKSKDENDQREKKKKFDARWIHMANRIDRQCSVISSVDS